MQPVQLPLAMKAPPPLAAKAPPAQHWPVSPKIWAMPAKVPEVKAPPLTGWLPPPNPGDINPSGLPAKSPPIKAAPAHLGAPPPVKAPPVAVAALLDTGDSDFVFLFSL